MHNKRGVSEVVTTILFVLLALAAVIIVGAFIRTQLTGTTSQATLTKACFDLNLEATGCKYSINGTSYNTVINYRRGNQKVDYNLTAVNLVFEFADGTTKVTRTANAPDLLEIKKDAAVLASLPSKASVAGILLDQTGKESSCEASPKITCEAA